MFLEPLQDSYNDNERFVVICPFAGIAGDLVALEMKETPVKAVITMEKEQKKRDILQAFLQEKIKDESSSFYQATHYNWGDLCMRNAIWLDQEGWALIVKKLEIKRGKVLFSGGPPCDNLPGTSNQGGAESTTGQSGLGGLSTGLWFLFAWMAVTLLETVQRSDMVEDPRELNWDSIQKTGLWKVDEVDEVDGPDRMELALYEDDIEQENAVSKKSDVKEARDAAIKLLKERYIKVIMDARTKLEDKIADKLGRESFPAGFCVGCSCESELTRESGSSQNNGLGAGKCRFDANSHAKQHMTCKFKAKAEEEKAEEEEQGQGGGGAGAGD